MAVPGLYEDVTLMSRRHSACILGPGRCSGCPVFIPFFLRSWAVPGVFLPA